MTETTEQDDTPVNDELARRVNYLYDRAMISEAVHRYFLALDEKRWDDLYDVLDDEFLLTAAPITGQLGRLPLDEFMEGLIARNGGFAGTVHLNSDHIVAIDGDVAHVKCHMYCPHWVDDTDAGLYLAYGRYDIDLRRRGESWVLTDLVLHIDGARGDAAAVYGIAAERQRRLS